ncbi:SBBP repeat-containing protein [Pseudomonas sp.]|uniref:SBBP repeat-containing protein n=1 Tax=Pseudomonas sp. TaxID=306 RepID=UPI00271674EE|nr:SBBP repeat-containing protein [Pseudomonas sp.]MDO8707085.1 SBBP repeat-containing protein [Pseudomonas sp.]
MNWHFKKAVIGIIAFLAILSPSLDGLAAQVPVEEWMARYDSGIIDEASKIVTDSLGNVYVAGRSGVYASAYDCILVKYDKTGNKVWVKIIKGGGADDGFNAVLVDEANNVYVTGASSFLNYGGDYITIKYDMDGNEIWVKRYGLDHGRYGRATSLALDKSGNVYVTGFSLSYSEWWTYADFTTIKYDCDGNEVWVRRYDGLQGEDYARAIVVDTSGNVYVTGLSFKPWPGDTDYATIKYDANGNEMWVKRYDSGGYGDFVSSLAVDVSGNVYVTGTSDISWAWWLHHSSFATIKYDANGNEVWIKKYNGGYYNDGAADLKLDAIGNVYVTGTSYIDYWSGDFLTIKYDMNGNEAWIRRYDGGNHDSSAVLTVDAGSNVYVSGTSYNSSGVGSYATVKYDETGNEAWAKVYSDGSDDRVSSHAVDAAGSLYLTGTGNYDFLTVKYTHDYINVQLDIKPGSFPNSINPNNNGVITVAIISTDVFNADKIDPLSVTFGSRRAQEIHGKGHLEDVNNDGILDLVFHFNTEDTGIQCGDTSATLVGQTYDKQTIAGSDSIVTVGCKKP